MEHSPSENIGVPDLRAQWIWHNDSIPCGEASAQKLPWLQDADHLHKPSQSIYALPSRMITIVDKCCSKGSPHLTPDGGNSPSNFGFWSSGTDNYRVGVPTIDRDADQKFGTVG